MTETSNNDPRFRAVRCAEMAARARRAGAIFVALFFALSIGNSLAGCICCHQTWVGLIFFPNAVIMLMFMIRSGKSARYFEAAFLEQRERWMRFQ